MITKFHQRAEVSLAQDGSALFTVYIGRWPCLERQDFVSSPEHLNQELHAASEMYPVIVTPAHVSTFRAKAIFTPSQQLATA